jgi:hypothetical protein
MLMETLPFAFDLRSAHNDAVERHEALGAPHVHARHVSPRGLLMPLAQPAAEIVPNIYVWRMGASGAWEAPVDVCQRA